MQYKQFQKSMGKSAVNNAELIIALLLLLLILVPFMSVSAQTPEIPQEFRGNVTVDGSPAPQGTTIVVRIGTTQIASTITDTQSRYGCSSPLLVSTINGSFLEFYVNGIKAKETALARSGEITTLYLTVNSISPSPSQQPSATPSGFSTSPAASSIISNLTITPSSVKVGEVVTITADMANSGTAEGTYKVVLQINNSTEIEQTVTLSPGRMQKLIYSVIREKIGTYNVVIDSQTGSFSVNSAEASWLSIVLNQPWWLYVIIGIGILLALLAILLMISRRNTSYF
jgi:hypothetical protein